MQYTNTKTEPEDGVWLANDLFWLVSCIGGAGDGLIDLDALVKYVQRRVSSKGIDP